jgi:hypothetical protein
MMVGYGVGRWTNQRRAREISDWLEPGMRTLGGTPTVQRVSRSAFRLQMANARRPFRTVTTSVVLISREVLPRWLWERLNGRRDLLVVHVTFRQPPALEAEMVNPENELGRRGEIQAQKYDWSVADRSPSWRLYYPPQTSLPSLEAITNQVISSPFEPWRLALRRSAPHMLLSMPMPPLDQIDSKHLVDVLTKLSSLAHSTPTGHEQ